MTTVRHLGPKLRTTAEGHEKFCVRCNDWWPADLEFFYSDPSAAGGLFSCCKACYSDYTRSPAARRIGKPSAPMFSAAELVANWSPR